MVSDTADVWPDGFIGWPLLWICREPLIQKYCAVLCLHSLSCRSKAVVYGAGLDLDGCVGKLGQHGGHQAGTVGEAQFGLLCHLSKWRSAR